MEAFRSCVYHATLWSLWLIVYQAQAAQSRCRTQCFPSAVAAVATRCPINMKVWHWSRWDGHNGTQWWLMEHNGQRGWSHGTQWWNNMEHSSTWNTVVEQHGTSWNTVGLQMKHSGDSGGISLVQGEVSRSRARRSGSRPPIIRRRQKYVLMRWPNVM